jgi:hypothetical protein
LLLRGEAAHYHPADVCTLGFGVLADTRQLTRNFPFWELIQLLSPFEAFPRVDRRASCNLSF